MDVLELTYVSYFWTIIAALSGIVAVVLFFAYDIRRCWRIVRGKQVCTSFVRVPVKSKKNHIEKLLQHGRTRKLAPEEKTELLSLSTYESTVLLTAEEIKPLETIHLVQDITMIEAQL